MNLSEMEELKKEYQLDNKIISEQTEIPIQVLQKNFEGDLMSQEYNTLLSLGRYFRELQEKLDHVAETYAYHAKKRQGNYTIEDYYDWPDDRRIELIDGVIYDMAAPFDVQLDKDHKTIVQPDILIVCDKDRIEDHRLYGAPDFAIEILSPSTKSKDMIIKFDKYKVAGVKEYWIIDPEEQTVTVHDFANNLFSENYSFHDQIPVGIYEGKLKIDLTFIKE